MSCHIFSDRPHLFWIDINKVFLSKRTLIPCKFKSMLCFSSNLQITTPALGTAPCRRDYTNGFNPVQTAYTLQSIS